MSLVSVVGNGYRERSRKAAFGSQLAGFGRHIALPMNRIPSFPPHRTYPWVFFIQPDVESRGLAGQSHRERRTGRVSSFAGRFTGATFLPLIQSSEVDILQTELSSSPDDGLENRAVRLNGRIRGIKLCR
jgi:hypothetical protein